PLVSCRTRSRSILRRGADVGVHVAAAGGRCRGARGVPDGGVRRPPTPAAARGDVMRSVLLLAAVVVSLAAGCSGTSGDRPSAAASPTPIPLITVDDMMGLYP